MPSASGFPTDISSTLTSLRAWPNTGTAWNTVKYEDSSAEKNKGNGTYS